LGLRLTEISFSHIPIHYAFHFIDFLLLPLHHSLLVCCTQSDGGRMERVRNLLPIIRWGPEYSFGALVGDVMGGSIMGLVVCILISPISRLRLTFHA
jgi:hypothetical protein